MKEDLIAFFVRCSTGYVALLEIYNFVKEVTNNFGQDELRLLDEALRDYGLMIEFTFDQEVDAVMFMHEGVDYVDYYVSKKDPTKILHGIVGTTNEDGKHILTRQMRWSEYLSEVVAEGDTDLVNVSLIVIRELSIQQRVALIKQIQPDVKFIWNVGNLVELENNILNRIKDKRIKTPKEELTFNDLFHPQFRKYIGVFIERLEVNAYTKEGVWNSIQKNEIGKVYWWLVEKGYCINDGFFSDRIKCFCSKFGINAYIKKDEKTGDSCVTVRQLNKSKFSQTEDKLYFARFNSAFQEKDIL